MLNNFLVILFSTIYLFLLNKFLISKNICLDQVTKNEKHKKLAHLSLVPLSGSFFLAPIIILLFYKISMFFVLFSLLMIGIGLLSDLKLISSPKKRFLFQFLVLVLFVYFLSDLKIDFRIEMVNVIMNNNLIRIIIISFFFLVLLNGYNFIDGVNNLASLNILIILIFCLILSVNYQKDLLTDSLLILILCNIVFVTFNFFGKSFLGDGGVYGLSFLVGFVLIYLSLISDEISPYFVAHLLWYPAFENLFSIIRRSFNNKKNYLADNNHLHQLLFRLFSKKKIFDKKYLTSSFTGILINFYLIFFYVIGFYYYSETKIQILLIGINIFIYIFLYTFLKRKYFN